MKAVIMAGGKGTRLRPYTYVLPKPLMPVNRFPVLELVIRQLAHNGFRNIILSTGYMSELIRSFCGNGERLGAKIEYSYEPKPLGTAGPLGLLRKKLDSTFLVINGDILVAMDFTDFLRKHKESNALLTLGLKKRTHELQFGLIEIDEQAMVCSYIEKPTQEYIVSTGISLMEPEILDYIGPEERLDMPDLANRLIRDGRKIHGYISDKLWFHLSRPDDFESANENWKSIAKELGIESFLDINSKKQT
jgi:NDP-sugar pyrophosphorylase family protein